MLRDLSGNLSPQLLERCEFGRIVRLKRHNITVACARYGPPPAGNLHKVTRAEYAPLTSRRLSIGTLDYYRNTVDKKEGSFTPSSSEGVLHAPDGGSDC